ncbi:myeloid cell surface antigen CD33 [Oncorhynchus mykiss]|uniref:myeloid cell surface antigen CD33 n=1 Tax=Oncorhynchus mykiss TaxID=8022 RepID=UPI0018784320|nr:myeloid cell surface antigen CD33 [Oncorhynchus mykiss]
MWVLIWAALLFSLAERATCQRQVPTAAAPSAANTNSIIFSPEEITAQTGLCAVISCTFNHSDRVKQNAAVWYKYPANGKRKKVNHIIFHSKNSSKAQEGYNHRVYLLEPDLTKGNCSVIINDIRENDAGQYQFKIKGRTFKLTVTALTQKPSVLTPPLTEGEPATLTCTAPGICSGTPPNITWTWRGTGDNITELRDNTTTQRREDLTRVTTTHFSTLTFTPSAKHHGNKVTCLVTFNGGVTTKKTLKLNVTQEVSKDILAMLLNPPLITAFVIGAACSATIGCIILCFTGKNKKRKERTPKNSDSKSPFTNLEMVACEDQQRDAGQAVMGEQTHLQVELREGTENGGLQTSGAAGHSAPGEEPKEVDYASINYSLLKKKTPEEAEKKTTPTESDYVEIKREKKNEGGKDGGEGSGVMEEVEGEKGEEMIGKDVENENGKPVRETDEDTALYSNVKAIIGGE